jgi:virginiamycin B lyase
MVTPGVTARQVSVKTRPATILLSLSYWVVCVLGVVVLEGSVLAAEDPIKEVALPVELSSAQSIAVDVKGRVWFTEKVGRKLVLFEPSTGEFTPYALPPSWGSLGFAQFALSPDGAIWFTVRRWAENVEEPNFLGKFDPSDGFFTKYVLSIDAVPEELLVDGDGLIWFAASNKNNLYRVDLNDFSVKGYPLPTSSGYLRGLAVDEKGQIWFAEPNANKIGKFVPGKNLFHEYEIPTSFANPGEITIDRNGNVWFVELSANRIAVFYPDWIRFDEAIIPTPNSSPDSIVVDGNDNLWFLEYRGNKVGVFTPGTALFREYTIPTFNSLPGALALDRERSLLWFSESSTEAKRLGVLSINVALADGVRKDATIKRISSTEALLAEGPRKTLSMWVFLLVLIVVAVVFVVAVKWLSYFKRPREGGAVT